MKLKIEEISYKSVNNNYFFKSNNNSILSINKIYLFSLIYFFNSLILNKIKIIHYKIMLILGELELILIHIK
jgi:hypothetical protein